MRILACPDKFRGTLHASDAASAMARAARALGHEVIELPLADGGEGTLEALGGANQSLVVTGPLGNPTTASWRIENGIAVIEMAEASGLELAGGRQGNDPVRATTRGTGELVAAALRAGASRVVVGVGGSATTDGGAGAIEVLEGFAPLSGEAGRPLVEVACDVTTRFVDAAAIFGPQKGATAPQIAELSHNLEQLAGSLFARFGRDARDVPGSGAAGGLAGGLYALGAALVPGFDLVARYVGLEPLLAGVDLAVTGEGRLDRTSLEGKVVAGVLERARAANVRVAAIAGSVEAGLGAELEASGLTRFVDLSQTYGRTTAFERAGECVAKAMTLILEGARGGVASTVHRTTARQRPT